MTGQVVLIVKKASGSDIVRCPGSIIDRVKQDCHLRDVKLGVLPVHVYGEILPLSRSGSLVRMAIRFFEVP